jgi:plastocyanin
MWGSSSLPDRTMAYRTHLYLVLGIAGLAHTPAPAHAQSGDTLPPWISTDTASHTVTLTLEAARPPGTAAARLNGEHDGSVQVNVPLGWTVRWHWRNADSAAHSLVVMAEREKLPTEGGQPALDQAASRAVTTGLSTGKTDETTFVADQAGWYWILCGVPNHALAGEWIGLRVDPATAVVSIKRRAGQR